MPDPSFVNVILEELRMQTPPANPGEPGAANPPAGDPPPGDPPADGAPGNTGEPVVVNPTAGDTPPDNPPAGDPPVEKKEWYDDPTAGNQAATTPPANQEPTAPIDAPNLDDDLKLIMEYKKSGKSLADFVKEYNVTDVSSMTDEQLVREGLRQFMNLNEEEYEQAMSEFETTSFFQKKQWAESFKQKFEERNANKLKELMGSNQQVAERQAAIAAKYNEELENFSKSIVNKELYGLKITDEMSKSLKHYIDKEFSFTKEDGSFDMEKVFSVAVWMKYGRDLVKANVTKAKNEGREQVIAQVTNPSKNQTGGSNQVSSGLEALEQAFNAKFKA